MYCRGASVVASLGGLSFRTLVFLDVDFLLVANERRQRLSGIPVGRSLTRGWISRHLSGTTGSYTATPLENSSSEIDSMVRVVAGVSLDAFIRSRKAAERRPHLG
jgi:hypothetical protein